MIIPVLSKSTHFDEVLGHSTWRSFQVPHHGLPGGSGGAQLLRGTAARCGQVAVAWHST